MEKAENKKPAMMDWVNAHKSDLAAYGGLLFCVIFFTITTQMKGESIWSASKLSTLMSAVIVTALMAVGAVFIYSLGNMDISIGKQIGLYSTIMVLLGNATGNLIIPVIICFVIAIIIGVINGGSGEVLHMYSVISSVVFMMILSGVSTIIYSSIGTRNIALRTIDTSILKSPVVMITALVIETVIITYFFKYTKFGKYAKAIGANKVAAEQSGINVVKYKVIPYIFLACTLVVASLFQMGYTGAASDSTGTGFEMNVMVALILGGMPLKGGMKSRVSCAIIGAFNFALLDVGLPIIGVPTKLTFMVKALIFLVVVLITCRQKKGVLPR